jgi:hypothetical protein
VVREIFLTYFPEFEEIAICVVMSKGNGGKLIKAILPFVCP